MNYFDNIPKTLYKYRVWNDNYHRRLLQENEVYLASPANLNDPFDASLPFRFKQSDMTTDNILRKLLELGRQIWPEKSDEELHAIAYERQQSGVFENGDYWKEVHAETKVALHNEVGILSLTTKNDNLLMWSHYSNCHKGFCVGINSEILFNTIDGTIAQVMYDENFPEIPLFGQGVETMVKMLNTKSPHWSYEDEYRLTKSKASNKAFVLPSEAITEVVLGVNMTLEDRTSIIDVIDRRLPHVQIFDVQTSTESFKLNINISSRIT